MLNFQENKFIYFNFIIIIVFSILFLVNINNLIKNEITLIKFKIANTKFNLIIIFVILPSLIFLLLQNYY